MFKYKQLLENGFSHHPNNPTNLNLQLQPNILQSDNLHNQHTPKSHSFITFIYKERKQSKDNTPDTSVGP